MIVEFVRMGMTEEQAIAAAVAQFRMGEADARFYLALEMGRIKGDVIEVDEEEWAEIKKRCFGVDK